MQPLAQDHLKYQANDTIFPTPSNYPPLAYDSVMAAGLAACQSQHSFFSGKELLDKFSHNVTFEGASGLVEIDPKTASRNYTSTIHKDRLAIH